MSDDRVTQVISGTGGLRALSASVGVAGLVLVVGGVPGTGTTGWPVDVVGPGAGLLAAAVAGLVTLRGVQTWRDKQAEHAASATRENRSRVYEQVLSHIVQSFTGGPPREKEALVRAMAASWASSDTLRALSDWFRYAARYRGEVHNKSYTFELIYRVVAAMRKDIDPEVTIPKDELLLMLFNEYDPTDHNPDGVGKIWLNSSGTVVGP